MSKFPLTHGSFSIERRYKAPPARVFAGWTDPELKARWFVGPPGWELVERTMDVRVGGQEIVRGRNGNHFSSNFQATYHDIVPNERIIYTYVMHVNEQRMSVSVATIELFPDGTGTRMVVTEQGAYFDSEFANESREQGTIGLMEQFGRALEN